jgi:hypothetical protein
MRLLSKLEKELCDRILKGSGSNNFLANIIDSRLQDVCIEVDYLNKKARLILTIRNQTPTNEESDAIIGKVQEISELVLQLVNLLQLLVKEGYILMLERGLNSKETKRYGQCVSNAPSMDYTFKDQNIVDLLCEYSNKEIYATEEFRRFCKKGYIARDEQRFQRQILFTQIALAVSSVALLFNVISNLLRKSPDSITINQEQIQSLKESIDKIPSVLSEFQKQQIIQTKELHNSSRTSGEVVKKQQ